MGRTDGITGRTGIHVGVDDHHRSVPNELFFSSCSYISFPIRGSLQTRGHAQARPRDPVDTSHAYLLLHMHRERQLTCQADRRRAISQPYSPFKRGLYP